MASPGNGFALFIGEQVGNRSTKSDTTTGAVRRSVNTSA